MGDGRGPAHRSPAPAALLSAKALRVDRAWLRAARGAWYAPVQFYTSTTLYYREPARPVISTRVPDYMLPWRTRRAPSTAVQASHEHDHNSHLIFRPRLTLARLSPLRCLSGLRRCSHICKALHPPTALPRVALVRTGDLRPQTDRAALSLPDFGDGTHLVAADGALRRAHAPPAGLIGARYGAHRKVRRATGAHALVPTWQE